MIAAVIASQALISGAKVVCAQGNVCTLSMQQICNFNCAPVKSGLLISNISNHSSDSIVNGFVGYQSLVFSSYYNLIGSNQCFTGTAQC
jgi:hypothetical protein